LPQAAPARIDRKATEVKLSQELNQAREAYDICAERYKRVVGEHNEAPPSKRASSSLLITTTMKAQLYATERYRRALTAYNGFLRDGEFGDT
jgi:hypothetical protein